MRETPSEWRHVSYMKKELTMESSPASGMSSAIVVRHLLDPEDRKIIEVMRAGTSSIEGMRFGIEARGAFDARVDFWMWMPHGFAGRIGVLRASGGALHAIGVFLSEKLQPRIRSQAHRDTAGRQSGMVKMTAATQQALAVDTARQ